MTEHDSTCLTYNHGACDCGVDDRMTDEQIDVELYEKEDAKE